MPGLAQTAVHEDEGDRLIPPSLFGTDSTSAQSSVSRLTALLPSLSLSTASSAREKPSVDGKRAGIHAFTVLARVIADPRFSPAALGLPVPEGQSPIYRVQEHVGESLIGMVAEWAAELEGDGVPAAIIEKKIEELAWFTALVYGVGGWAAREKSQNKEFNADFLMYVFMSPKLGIAFTELGQTPRQNALGHLEHLPSIDRRLSLAPLGRNSASRVLHHCSSVVYRPWSSRYSYLRVL